MATVDGYALPKPGVPKTLGILNVIFAVLLILGGLCIAGSTVLAPALVQIAQKAQDDVKAKAEAQKVGELKILDDREKAATTDEEKATIAKERDVVVTFKSPEPPDVTASLEILKDPRVKGFTVAQIVSGLILHVMLLVAGIGLIRLTPWGRTLGVWWAGLQILQLVVLAALSYSLIQPIQRPITERQIAELKQQAEGPNPPPNSVMTLQFTETMAKLTPVTTAAYFVAGMVYPIICLILLQTPGARAACDPRSPSTPPSTGFGPA